MDVQIDMTDAVNNMYNFKFPQAESEFLKLRAKYPQHPMPYFLMGLSNFWKFQANDDNTAYDDKILAYMDSSIKYAEPLFESKDTKISTEGAFFLSAAYGFKGRILSDRGKYAKAIGPGKNAMTYMQKSKEKGDLSPEFMFGDGLYNYYAEYLGETMVWLKPVLALFPKGNKKLGIEQLTFCSNNAFFTRTEAQSYLMRIYTLEEENAKAAIPIAKYLYATFPDNPFFQRFYCRLLFSSGNFQETEKVALNAIAKIDSHYVGYDALTGRFSAYMLGYIYNFKKDPEKSKNFFKRTIDFGEEAKAYKTGYYLHANAHLGSLLGREGKLEEACICYQKIKKYADKDEETIIKEASDFIEKHKCKKKNIPKG